MKFGASCVSGSRRACDIVRWDRPGIRRAFLVALRKSCVVCRGQWAVGATLRTTLYRGIFRPRAWSQKTGKTQSRARIACESLRWTVWEVLERVRLVKVVQGQACLDQRAAGVHEGVSGQKILGGSARAT
jgi:hypothetical protein